MQLPLIIWIVIILTGCNLKEKKSTQLTKDSSFSQIDTTPFKDREIEGASEADYYDSLTNAFVDTTTLKGKRQ